MSTNSPPLSASDILAAAGVAEDQSYYGPFVTEEDRVVLTVPMRIQAAWERNDAGAFADVFCENGSLLMRDDQLTSREEIHSFMAAGFQGAYQGARVKGWPISVKHLGDDVAIVVTEGGIIFAGENAIAPERQIRAVWVIVRRDGQWKLMSHQSSPIRG